MKILFVGPSLPDAPALCGSTIEVRPPAAHGDVLAAVRDGAAAIGIIDGNFEHVAPVWHKEILFALENDVAFFGAASMGALRAAECDAFGMIGIGRIYQDYATGSRIDDADVALLHGPAELGYAALSVPLVNVDATLDRLASADAIDKSYVLRMRDIARTLFYKDRTWSTIIEQAGYEKDKEQLIQLIHAEAVDQKREDAIALVYHLLGFHSQSPAKRGDWVFRETSLWRSALNQPAT